MPPSTVVDSVDAASIVRAGQEMQLAHINELNLRSRPSLALNKLNWSWGRTERDFSGGRVEIE